MKDLAKRKNDLLDIVLNSPHSAMKRTTGFEQWRFEHCAMPELHLDEIDLGCRLFGKTLRAPLLISSMTGGASRAAMINRHLAQAAQQLGLAMGVGSQRVALESRENSGLTRERANWRRISRCSRTLARRRLPGLTASIMPVARWR